MERKYLSCLSKIMFYSKVKEQSIILIGVKYIQRLDDYPAIDHIMLSSPHLQLVVLSTLQLHKREVIATFLLFKIPFIKTYDKKLFEKKFSEA